MGYELRPTRFLLAFIVGLTALTACTSPQSLAKPTPRPLGVTLPAYEASDSPESGADLSIQRVDPNGAMTLRDALAAALLQNPELSAFSWEVRVQEARTLQAGLRPNPEVQLELENFAGTDDFGGTGQSETTLQLGQLIELAGKRIKRRRVAELGTTRAGWTYEIRRVSIFADVVRAFTSVLAAQERLKLATEMLALANETRDSVARQVRSGATSKVEQTRAEVAAASQGIEVQRARSAIEATRLRLASLWGAQEPQFEKVLGDLYAIAPPPSSDAVVASLERSPVLLRWLNEIERHEAIIELEDAQRLPDVTANAGVRRLEDTNDSAFLVGVSIPFPIYDRNQGGRLAARRELAKARHLQRAAHVKIGTTLRTELIELKSSYTELNALREIAIPQAKSAYSEIRRGYLRGLFRYVDVLDAHRTLFQLQSQELNALHTYHTSVAELERITGTPLRPQIQGTQR